ncbi:MAG: IclR helix-turn-helix protein [Euryarchaeota archaeon]|nr:IclR helix-turn-helix protein [Euryarchaeota archaeon]
MQCSSDSIDYVSFYKEHIEGLKQISKDEWKGHCPFGENHHKGVDHNPSFSVNAKTGQYQCFSCGAKGNHRTFCKAKGIPYPDQKKQWTKPEATFDYKDENGNLLYQAVRYPGKKFMQRQPYGNGKWIYQVKGIKKVPYHLPELLKANPDVWVFIPEGEKHCDRLYNLGLIAICNVAGAEKWTPDLNPYLKDRKVCILPDNDNPGQRHGQKVAHSLCMTAKEVRILNLPGLNEKGDIINWLDEGHTIDELFKLLEKTLSWKPDTEQKTILPPKREPVIRTFKELHSRELPEVKWIVVKIIPQGLVILAGKPKVGKSWLILHIALSVALGGVALGSAKVEKGVVLYLALEDTERRLKDRGNKLLSGELPPDNFYYCTNDWGRLPEAGIRIEKFLDEHKDTRLVVVDTLQKIRAPSKKGAGVYEQDYEAISELKTIADKYNVAIVVVHHQRKATSDDVFDTISGSLGITGSADTIAILRKEARTKADGILHVTGRDIEESELALNFDANTGLWQLMGGAEEYRLSKERTEVIELLKKSKDPMTPVGIAKGLDKKQGTIRKLLKSMLENNQVSVNNDGKYSLTEKSNRM